MNGMKPLANIHDVLDRLGNSEIKVYECLKDFDLGDGSYPSYKTIAKETNLSKHTAMRATKKLWSLDVIRKAGQREGLRTVIWATEDSNLAVLEGSLLHPKQVIAVNMLP